MIVFLVILTIVISSVLTVATQYGIRYVFGTKEIEDIINADNLSFVKIMVDNSSGSVPLEVKFESFVFKQNETTLYYWDFGDGAATTEKSPTHVYNKEGIYNCSLRVINNSNAMISDHIYIKALPNEPPIAKIIVPKKSGYRPIKMHFDADVFDPDGEIVTYHWEMKRPSPWYLRFIEFKTEYHNKSFDKLFWRPGNYEVTLTVTDDAGNTATDFVRINIDSSIPEIIFGLPALALARAGAKYSDTQGKINILIKLGIWDWLYNKFNSSGRAVLMDLMELMVQLFEINWSPEDTKVSDFHSNHVFLEKFDGVAKLL